MLIPTEVADIKLKAAAELTQVVGEINHYEVDLISFVAAHKWLALQFALIVCSPVALLAFVIGKHFHS
jgi:hypothetical protein